MPRSPHAPGLTMIECLMASALLAFVVAAAVTAVTAGQDATAQALSDLRGSALAEALMEEVVAKPYNDPAGVSTPGPETGEARTTFNCADDFHGYSEAANALKDAGGTLYSTPYQHFNRGVTCVYGNSSLTGLSGSTYGLTVTVTVTDSQGPGTWTLIRFIPAP